MSKVLEQLVKDGWEDTGAVQSGLQIFKKGELRLEFNGKYVVWMYNLSKKNYKYQGRIPREYSYEAVNKETI